MCIRDSLYTSVNQADTHIAHFVSLRIISQLFLWKQFADDNGIDIQEAGIDAVSYTHLGLRR